MPDFSPANPFRKACTSPGRRTWRKPNGASPGIKESLHELAESFQISFVFQGIHLLPCLSALDNVELPMSYARMSAFQRRKQALEALELLGIVHLKDRYPSQMSGGQAQRVAIARAIAPSPLLLLADEPTGALDRKSGSVVLQAFQELHENTGVTIVIVTHDPLVSQHAERIVSLEDGQIIGDYPVEDRIIEANVGGRQS